MKKIFHTISCFIVILILSLLTACPVAGDIDSKPAKKKSVLDFDQTVINTVYTGMGKDLKSNVTYQSDVVGTITFNATTGEYIISIDNAKLNAIIADLTNDSDISTVKNFVDNQTLPRSFFYFENKFYFSNTKFFCYPVNNISDAIQLPTQSATNQEISVFDWMNMYTTFNKSSIEIIKPLMETIEAEMAKTTYSFKFNNFANIGITAFGKTFTYTSEANKQNTLPAWFQVFLSYISNNRRGWKEILYPNSNLGELFNDYPNIKAFFTAFNTQITEFYNSIFTTDFEAKVQTVEFHVNYCGADTQDSNVIIIQYFINEENKTYTYKFYQNKVEAPNDAPEELTYIIEYAYNDYDNLAFYISYKSVGGNFQKMTELLNLISQIK